MIINPNNEEYKNEIKKNLNLFFDKNELVNKKINKIIKNITVYFSKNNIIIDNIDLRNYIIKNFEIYLLDNFNDSYKELSLKIINNDEIIDFDYKFIANYIHINYNIADENSNINKYLSNFNDYYMLIIYHDKNNKLNPFYNTYLIYNLTINNKNLKESNLVIRSKLFNMEENNEILENSINNIKEHNEIIDKKIIEFDGYLNNLIADNITINNIDIIELKKSISFLEKENKKLNRIIISSVIIGIVGVIYYKLK